jgi:hypothetical protein
MYKICMAKLLNIYIHDDNTEGLDRVDNKARLINELLREHFKKTNFMTMTKAQLEREIKREEIKREYEQRLKELNG